MRERVKTLLKLKSFLGISILLVSCQTRKIPSWNGKLFVGNSQSMALERAQSGESCHSSEECFDDFIGMSSEDFKSFYDVYVNGCRSWSSKDKDYSSYVNNLNVIKKLAP